jgi:DNA-binding transcriptional LysR family regulator
MGVPICFVRGPVFLSLCAFARRGASPGSVGYDCSASPQYLAEHGEPDTPGDLASHDCLIYSYLSTANEAALAYRGILMTPSFHVAALLRQAKLRQILVRYKPEWERF